MFAKLTVVATVFIFSFALAAPAPWDNPSSTTTISGQCSTGQQSCCNAVSNATDPITQGLLGALGLELASITGQVGLGCVPVTLIGTGSGADCSAQPVCCENNNFNGVIAFGCNPFDLNL